MEQDTGTPPCSDPHDPALRLHHLDSMPALAQHRGGVMKKPVRSRRSPAPSRLDAASAIVRRETMRNPAAPFELKDDEIERALVTGEYPDLLKRYFGDAEYQSLQGLARESAARSVRGGPRVLILPGLMGS